MSYPTSSDVSAGQPTAADHYNNLRADALRLGNAVADSVPLGTLMNQFQYNMNLIYLATNRLRVVATPTSPVHVVVDGVMLSTTSFVDLAVAHSGAANTYYVFAVRSVGSTTFTLAVNTSSPDFTYNRNIGSFYWDGSNIIRASIITNYEATLNTVLALQSSLPTVNNGRLCLTSGAPTADTASSGVLYFTPYNGSKIGLYTPGYGWTIYPFTEVSLSLSAVSANVNYDVFLWDYLGTLTLYLEAWASDTARSVALVLQDGVFVRSGQVYKRYLGTIRGSGSNLSADSLLSRFVWNNDNQIFKLLFVNDANNHTYTGSTLWRGWNNVLNATDTIYLVCGQSTLFFSTVQAAFYSSVGTTTASVAVGEDGITPYSGMVSTQQTVSANLTTIKPLSSIFGFHYFNCIENISVAGSTGTFQNMVMSGWFMG